MLGFSVYVHRLPEPYRFGAGPLEEWLKEPSYDSQRDEVLKWQTTSNFVRGPHSGMRPRARFGGWLDWIDDLVSEGSARQLWHNGYPMLYLAETDAVIDAAWRMIDLTPEAEDRLESCRLDNGLVVVAWDLS